MQYNSLTECGHLGQQGLHFKWNYWLMSYISKSKAIYTRTIANPSNETDNTLSINTSNVSVM